MPPLTRLPFMVLELLVYGLVSGLCAKKLFRSVAAGCNTARGSRLRQPPCRPNSGAGSRMLSLLIAGNLLHLAQGRGTGLDLSNLTGLPGIVLQWLLVPLVRTIEKGASFRHGLGRRQNKLR